MCKHGKTIKNRKSKKCMYKINEFAKLTWDKSEEGEVKTILRLTYGTHTSIKWQPELSKVKEA